MPFVDEFIIVTNENYADIMETQLKAFQDVRYRIIYESRSCGTFAAVSLASVFMNPSDLMMVTVSDLVIESGSYKDSVIKAKEVAKTGTIANIVSSRNGEHAGIYVCMVGVFNKALRGIYPDIAQTRKVIRRKLKTVSHIINVPENIMERFPKLRMQADLFTRIDDIIEINADFEYRDIDSIADINDEDNQNDYGHKNIINNECEDVVMINTADKHLIVANHINNISIVNTEDATYISDREHICSIKDIVIANTEEYKPYFEHSKVSFREWGMHQVLAMTKNYKVKKVTVFPGMMMNLHQHELRAEYWSVVEGTATITIGTETKDYHKYESVFVPIGVKHKVANKTDSNVVIIEVGIGDSILDNDMVKIYGQDSSDNGGNYVRKDNCPIVKLDPAFKDNLWGGTKIRDVYGKKCDYDVIGESWELSAHPDGQSRIAEGYYKGMLFNDYLSIIGKEALGWKCQAQDRFPVLIKFIDAKQALSIQIHPDDEYALENENEYGKNEMWYVLDAEPGAYLYCGLSRASSKEEIEERIKNNTITEILNKIEVKKGDVVMVKAGTIHAIGAGIFICEIQQNSNCTYRMYDYDRRDKFGNPRELHIAKSLDVVNPVKYEKDNKCNVMLAHNEHYMSKRLVQCKYFEVIKYEIEDEAKIPVDEASFLSVIVIDGEGTIMTDDNDKELKFKAGESFFINAGKRNVVVKGRSTCIITHV